MQFLFRHVLPEPKDIARVRFCTWAPQVSCRNAWVRILQQAKPVEVSSVDVSLDAAKRTVQITYDQYRAGVVDFTPVYLFEGTLTTEQDALAQARGDIALSLVDLYRALGGGWEARLKPEGIVGPPVPAPTTQRSPKRTDVLNPPTTTTAPATRPGP
jgi:hypothetical protein